MRKHRLLAVAFGALLLLGGLSCSTDGGLPTGTSSIPVAPDADLIGNLLGKLLSCQPLPEATTQQWVGSAGGFLSVGPHTLFIPPGALSRPVLITANAPSDYVRSVRLYPEGLQFAHPALLTLSYADCSLVTRLLPKRIAYTTDLLQILSYVLSLDNPLRSEVTGRLDHFSRYAVAW